MRDQVQAEFAAAREHARELLGRIAALAAVEPHADELVAKRQRLFERGERGFLGQVAQEAQDERRVDAVRGLRLRTGACQPVDDGRERDAAVRVRLRVEEDLGAHDVIGRRAVEVRHAHVEEVVLADQHAGARVVDVEEALQVAKRVRRAQRFDGRIRKRDPVALCEPKDELGLE